MTAYADYDGPNVAARAVTPTDEIRQHLGALVERLGEQRAILARRHDEVARELDEVARELDRCQMLLNTLDKQVAIDREGEKRDGLERSSLVESDLDVVKRAADTQTRWRA